MDPVNKQERTRLMAKLDELLPTDDKGQYVDNPNWGEESAKEVQNIIAQVQRIDQENDLRKQKAQLGEYKTEPAPADEDAEKSALLKAQAGDSRSVDELTARRLEGKRLVNEWLRKGTEHGEHKSRLVGNGYNPFNVVDANDLNKGTDDKGGYTVPDELFAGVIERLRADGNMRSFCRNEFVSTGRQIQYPTHDPIADVGAIVAENDDSSSTTMTFGQTSVDFDTYTSRPIALSRELIQDSAFDIETYVRDKLVDRIGRYQEQVFVQGRGNANGNAQGINQGQRTGTEAQRAPITGEPGARVPPGDSNVGATAAGIRFQDIHKLMFSVDEAYLENGRARFLMNWQTLGALQGLTDTQNRPLWLPDVSNDNPVTGGRLRGFPYSISRFMDGDSLTGSGTRNYARPILFGDFNYYLVLDATSLEVFRFTDSVYQERNQVGFLALMRMACKYIPGPTGSQPIRSLELAQGSA